MVTVIELRMKPQGTKTMRPSPPYRASHYGHPCKDSTSVTSDFGISRRLDSLRICSRRTKGPSWRNGRQSSLVFYMSFKPVHLLHNYINDNIFYLGTCVSICRLAID